MIVMNKWDADAATLRTKSLFAIRQNTPAVNQTDSRLPPTGPEQGRGFCAGFYCMLLLIVFFFSC